MILMCFMLFLVLDVAKGIAVENLFIFFLLKKNKKFGNVKPDPTGFAQKLSKNINLYVFKLSNLLTLRL